MIKPQSRAPHDAYLGASYFINFDDQTVARKARDIAADSQSVLEIVSRSFEFVRDEIPHSLDCNRNAVTARASEVLEHQTGFCYAKSHLLAALLRANGVPAGLCYQRLSLNDSGATYCLHGLNAVFLEEFGWLRIDARGNKPGINAQFRPPDEILAFETHAPDERDLPEIWSEPLPIVIAALESFDDIYNLANNLPDVSPVAAG